jgi:hypothetical protein
MYGDGCNFESGVDTGSCVRGNIFIKLSLGIVLIFNMSPDFFSLSLFSFVPDFLFVFHPHPFPYEFFLFQILRQESCLN